MLKGLFDRLLPKKRRKKSSKQNDVLRERVHSLYRRLAEVYGTDKLVLKAGKLEALKLMRSGDLRDQILGLLRLMNEDPSIQRLPERNLSSVLDELEDKMADVLARRAVEQELEKKVAEKMQERHDEYVKQLRKQIMSEDGGPDNAQTLKKYAELEKLERRPVPETAMEKLRPKSLEEIVGQERAIKALLAKVASPYPQHVILYGPPGVGKTTAARLVLEAARKLDYTPFGEEAKFVEVDGTTLRWDPREVSNPLLGSVHDPIYQGARRDLADKAIPEPKPGLVTEAHGGVLFIDEIGELDLMLQNKLLKVLEDKRVRFDSAYFDPDDPNVPKYIKKLFEDGAPADFVLIGATTRHPSEINPALRSRCAEIFFEPLTGQEIETIVSEAAARLGVEIEDNVPAIISRYTVEGRKAINILADAYSLALRRQAEQSGNLAISKNDIYEVAQVSRLSPYVMAKASDTPEVGKVFGLGVSGFLGSVLEIEAVAFPAREKGKGKLRFNDTAGSMARDSVFNAASLVRLLSGEDLAEYDVHINVIGGGKIDGPSAGCALMVAIVSALQNKPVRQDVAITGEVSIQGKVKPVGGVFEKIYGARRAGMRKVLVPAENEGDIPRGLDGIEVITVSRIEEVLEHVFAEEQPKLKRSLSFIPADVRRASG